MGSGLGVGSGLGLGLGLGFGLGGRADPMGTGAQRCRLLLPLLVRVRGRVGIG